MATLIGRWMALFFRLLYHPMAWAYDFVAWGVSLGKWETWVKSVLPMVTGQNNILELGFGPGHLQESLLCASLRSFGLDESHQMALIAKKRLARRKIGSPNLVHGLAENIPFVSGYFDAVLSTFPTPYVFLDETILEIHRVLRPSGRLIVLLAALQPGNSLPEKLVHLLFQITHQAPPENTKFEDLLQRYRNQGFDSSIAWRETQPGKLLIMECVKLEV